MTAAQPEEKTEKQKELVGKEEQSHFARMRKLNALRLEMGQNARRCAEEQFDRKNSYSRIIDTILRGE